MASVFSCFLLYYNFKLLGEFFFVTVAAAITSLWLRQVKGTLVGVIEQAFTVKFFFVKTSSIFKMCKYFLFPMFAARNPCKLIDQVRFHYHREIATRKRDKLTIFNCSYDVLVILLVYIGLSKFGWKFTLLATL